MGCAESKYKVLIDLEVDKVIKLQAENNAKHKKIIELEKDFKSNDEKNSNKINSLEESLKNEKINSEKLEKISKDAADKVRILEENLVNEKKNIEESEKISKGVTYKVKVLEENLVNEKKNLEKSENISKQLAEKLKVLEENLVNEKQNLDKLEKINKLLVEKVRVFEEQRYKILLGIALERTLDLSIKFEKKKMDLTIELQSQFEVKPTKQVLKLFEHQLRLDKPKQTMTSTQILCEPDLEYQKSFIHLYSNKYFSYKTVLNIQEDSQILIEKTLPQLEFSQFNIINQTKSYTSESALTLISLPSFDIDNFFYSIQSDSSALFNLPVTKYLSTATKPLTTQFQSPCISNKNHIFSFTPENIFKYWSKYNSFKPTCSQCSSSKFYQFWSCKHCSLIICPSCKPLNFECPTGHSYTKINNLQKFNCSSCSIEKVSVSLHCEPCSIQLCDLCGFLRTQAKFECENSHKLKPDNRDIKCSFCSKENSFIGCECSGMCQTCFEYIESPVFYHPGVGCENGHLLHVVEKREKCSVCENENDYLYYCKDCSVFVCDSCADSYVKALYKRPLCKKMHRLEVDCCEPKNNSIKQVELRKFYCELCDISFSFKNVPNLG